MLHQFNKKTCCVCACVERERFTVCVLGWLCSCVIHYMIQCRRKERKGEHRVCEWPQFGRKSRLGQKEWKRGSENWDPLCSHFFWTKSKQIRDLSARKILLLSCTHFLHYHRLGKVEHLQEENVTDCRLSRTFCCQVQKVIVNERMCQINKSMNIYECTSVNILVALTFFLTQ